MNEKETKRRFPSWGWVAIISSTIVLAVCFGGWHYRQQSEGSFTLINALFSGLAFVGLTIAIFMQKEELELQRNELKLTRDEFDQQNRTLKKQRFENSFFQMLAVHNQKVIQYTSSTGNGPDGLAKFYGEIVDSVKHPKEEIEKTIELYNSIKSDYGRLQYVPYINNIFLLISMIKDTRLVEEGEKPFYLQVLSSQLSAHELNLVWIEANIRIEDHYLESMGFFSNLTDPVMPRKVQNFPSVI